MLSKRVIPCLDVRAGRLTKGIKFQGNVDIGDPVESARRYYEEGADEIVFYDITASAEERGIFLDVVERVASQIFIPFSVGGGISSVADMRAVLNAGAEKVSINSAAVRNPDLVADGAAAFGSQAIVVGMDVLRVPVSESIPSGYEIVIQGGRRRMGIDAIDISDQKGAQAAVDVIKAAINYVSDVRGTLGATQNRLDHTINNLSVMEENIQDAESTIRDTDVADEMMAYTKNNILVQSAQAMLAQANQVPQGVLQLLQ